MRQLMFEAPGTVRWVAAEPPSIDGPDGDQAAIVRPLAVALCDLDVGALRGAYPLAGPFPLGHEGVAEVVEVGESVTSVSPGDRVIVPFQISCGSCAPCRRGRTGNCTAHPPLSSFGLGTMGGLRWGGLLADRTLIPHADAMLVPLPVGIEPATVASLGDNIADAWRCVGPQLRDEPGAEVLVVAGDSGPNSIGLYAAGLAVAEGSGRVVYLDDDPARRGIAESLGAETMDGPPPRKAGSFPITVDASGSGAGLRCALESTAFDGTCTSPSVYLADQAIPMFSMYSRCCTLHTGRAHARAAIPDALRLVTAGFDPALVTTDLIPFDDAESALENPSMKPVLLQR